MWFSGLKETNWKPFESFSFFLKKDSWGAFRGDGGSGTADGSCRVTVGINNKGWFCCCHRHLQPRAVTVVVLLGPPACAPSLVRSARMQRSSHSGSAFSGAYNHRFLLVEGSFCASTRAGMAHAHLLSTWFNANGNAAAPICCPRSTIAPESPPTVLF